MRTRPILLSTAIALALMGWMAATSPRSPAYLASAQQATAPAPERPVGTIQEESNLVLVDAIVTDKKGNYIRDLEANDFHVLEDGKEQPISTFTRAADSARPNAPAQHYLVLFFDDSTMDPADQMRARQAAGEFIAKTASSSRLMAVVDFGGTLRLIQNFTADAGLLKRAVQGVKLSSLSPNEPVEVAALGGVSLSSIGSDFGARSLLFALRNLSKKLRGVPGRKTLILFSSGFPLTPERQSELTATIDAANKANVAIYPLDVRGLFVPGVAPVGGANPLRPNAGLRHSPFPHEDFLLAALLAPPLPQQRPPSGGAGPRGGAGGGGFGGGGGSRGGGGTTTTSTGGRGGGTATGGGTRGTGGAPTTGATTGTRGGTTGPRGGGGGNSNAFNPNRFTTQPPIRREIIPPIPDSATTNQQILYALADGTGGFPIFNTNDFLGGLEKIAHELDEYYILGYVPPHPTHDGSYHRIQVKVDKKDLRVRARSGYYDLKRSGADLLAGQPVEKSLAAHAASPDAGTVPISMKMAHFYMAANEARVDLAVEIPGNSLDFAKDKGKFHLDINVLGTAHREDGTLAARFSDSNKLELEKKEHKELSKSTYSYRNSFDIAPGTYKLKLVLAAGAENFGKVELPLVIEPYNGKQFGLSGVFLSREYSPVSEVGTLLDQALLEERKPLVAQDVQFLPSATNRFDRDDKVALYVEVYEPLLLSNPPPRVGIIYNIIDRKTNQQVYTSNTRLVNSFAQPGNLVIPVADQIPMEKLKPGEYRIDVIARDGTGNASPVHSADFTLN